jgi:hypothetical protein
LTRESNVPRVELFLGLEKAIIDAEKARIDAVRRDTQVIPE